MNIKKKVKQLFSGSREDGKTVMSAEIIRQDGKTYYLLDEETFCTLLALSGADIKEGEE